MSTKLCPKCDKNLPLTTDYFHRRGSGFQDVCKTCKKELDRRRYQAGHKKCKNKERRQQLQATIDEYKQTRGCQLCPENTPCCLDFHHHNNDKEFEIADGLARGLCLARLLKEAKKCTVLCANCHRKVHGGILDL